MIEALFGVLLSWYFVAGVALWLVFLSHIDSKGWPELFFALLLVCLHAELDISFKQLLVIVPVYLILGVFYSVFRFKRLCASIAESVQKGNTGREAGIRKMSPQENIGNIARWIAIWPFSALANIIGDTLGVIALFVKNYLISIYENVSNKYCDKIK